VSLQPPPRGKRGELAKKKKKKKKPRGSTLEHPASRHFLFVRAPRPEPGIFRCVSYNVLSPQFSLSHVFPHCAKDFLRWNYRWPLILKQIEFANADAICLQEMPEEVWQETCLPQLRALGYNGLLRRLVAQRHGAAVCFRSDKWRYLMHENTSFTGCDDRAVALNVVLQALDETSALQRVVVSAVQLCAYGASRAPQIEEMPKMLEEQHLNQTQLILSHLALFGAIPCVVGGDIDACPGSVVYNEFRRGIPLKHEREELVSAGLNVNGKEPRSTTFTSLGPECHDYIFFTKRDWEAVSFWPIPTQGDVAEGGGGSRLPSAVLPSDHYLVGADLVYTGPAMVRTAYVGTRLKKVKKTQAVRWGDGRLEEEEVSSSDAEEDSGDDEDTTALGVLQGFGHVGGVPVFA